MYCAVYFYITKCGLTNISFHTYFLLSILTEKMRYLINSCLEKAEMQLHQQSDQNPLWLLLLLALVPVAIYVILNAIVHLHIKWLVNVGSEILFLVTVGAEAFVTMRSQFPHSNRVMFIHAAVTLATSIGAWICLSIDIKLNVRNKLPMQGKRERNFGNCWCGYISFCNWFGDIWVTVKLLSKVDKIRVVAGILQVLVRFCELVARGLCVKYACKGKVLEFNFSIIPLLLAFACFAKRSFRQSKGKVTSVSCIMVGDYVRDEAAVPLPSTDFLNTIIGLPLANFTPHITKSFDMWSINVRGEVNFNMIEKKGNINAPGIWKFPPADFVILYFSLVDVDSFDRVTTTWTRYLNNHAPGVPIILVGRELGTRNERLTNNEQGLDFVTRDRGYALAWQINALAYLECSIDNEDSLSELLRKIEELAS